MIQVGRRIAPALLAAAVLLGIGTAAQAATAYRYWAYFVGSGTGWQYSQRGPATEYPADGDVQGWRFGVQADAADLAPRSAPKFATLCAKTTAEAGHIRVGVVLDFGTPADEPAGERPPTGPVLGCVVVPDGASGLAVLFAAVGSSGVRIGTGSDAGLVCGIAGYPRAECAVAVTVHTTPTPTPAPTATPTATRTAAHPPTPTAAPATTPAADPRPTPALAVPTAVPHTSAAAQPPTTSSEPASVPVSVPVSESSSALSLASLQASTTLSVTESHLPVSVIVGGVVILGLAIGTAIRLRRGRRGRP